MNRNLVFMLIASVFFLASCGGSGKESSENEKQQSSERIKPTVPVGINIGDRAPDMEYPSPEGEMYRLSSLQGKMVLIDFWAGWCPPCRAENPNLVSTYKKYHDKEFTRGDGFTIYSVSLDRNKEEWVSAIEQDNLEWEYHVSDLQFWNSVPAAMYQVRGIPASFLIDGNGIIIAKNLRGEALPQKLEELRK
jgi:thiol-disulfide isomerase/thioredoxin